MRVNKQCFEHAVYHEVKRCSPAAYEFTFTKSCSQTQTNKLFRDLKFKRVSTQLDDISLLHT